ncbi:CpaD family pilus assembly protein [Maricaulis sp. CAU 1757]
MVRRTRHIGLLAGALLVLGACASTPHTAYVPRDNLGLPQADAVAERYRAEFAVDPRDNGLTWAQRDVLAAVADEYKARGHGQLVISYPQGGQNEAAAIDAIAEARSYFYERGIDWRAIAGGPYDARGQSNAAVIFSFIHYRAVAPDCDQGWENLAIEWDNQAHSRFGCATAANLAAMIADPRDLLAPRDMDPVDASRRQTVLDRYRAGESTASQRSDYESGAVSDVSRD